MINGLAVRAAAVAQVVVDDLTNPVLSDDDLHHVGKVLRARQNEEVALTDGSGHWRMSKWSNGVIAEGETYFEDKLLPEITIGFALTKSDKPGLVVQKLTEIGVDVIQPVIAARTVVKWDEKKRAENVRRLRRVAYEAAMQSRRVWLPVVEDIVAFDALSNCAVAESSGDAPSLDAPFVVVGPEGGWTREELGSRPAVDLGPTILRAETAAIAIAVKLTDLRAKHS